MTIPRKRSTHFRHERAVSSAAAWLYAAVFVASAGFVAASGRAIDLLPGLEAVILLLLVSTVVVPLTAGASDTPAWEIRAPTSATRLWVPTVVCLAFAVIIPIAAQIRTAVPLVPPLAVLGQATAPLAAALAAGARWRELSFGPGHRTWQTSIVLVAPIAVGLVVLVDAGMVAGPTLRPVLLLYLFSAAIPEEVHFRGVLLTRLMRLWGTSWAIVASSLLFGAYHAVANVTYFNGAPVPVAIALGFVVEGTLGLSFAIVFLRTRNLVAVVALHTVLDTFNFTLLPHVQRFFM